MAVLYFAYGSNMDPDQMATRCPSTSAVGPARLAGWRLTHDEKRIRKDWTMKHFKAALEFFNAVGQVAEEDQHHPDLHLEGYRNVWIEIYTHAIGGLSENDFILAAKIDKLPVKLKGA